MGRTGAPKPGSDGEGMGRPSGPGAPAIPGFNFESDSRNFSVREFCN